MQDIQMKTMKELLKENHTLRMSMERYKLIIEGFGDGLWDWDMLRDTAYLSEEWGRMLGFEEQEVNGFSDQWMQRLHPKDKKRIYVKLEQCMKEKRSLYTLEYRLKLINNKYIWVSSRGRLLYNELGEPVRMSGSHTDITKKKRLEEKLENLAYRDQLTGAMLRTAFMDQLNRVVEEANRGEANPAVMFLDIDSFKMVNDIYGHSVGDILLRKIAARLKTCISKSDYLCRIGGDEFAILLTDIDNTKEADEIAKRIIDLFHHPIPIFRYKLNISTSIGIAVYSGNSKDGRLLLQRADMAMYRAKELGKNNSQHYSASISETRNYSNNIRRDLFRAIERKELYLLYQPLVDATTNRLVKMEALIRWRHTKNGIINPADFIPIAEETQLIIPIGEWVLNNALHQLKSWHEMGFTEFTLSVNASIIQLQQTDFAEVFLNALSVAGISPEYIELEITESALVNSMDNVEKVLHRLRGQGVKLSIDDYGTGYNSLKYIQKFKIDCIKIDRSFVKGINENINNIIIRHIIALGHKIKAEIVAEGVETKEQLEYLREEGCDIIQGYYFSKPLSVEEVTAFLRKSFV